MTEIKKEEFINNYNKNIPQIVSRNIITDTDTPVSAFLKISKDEKYSFLLESVEGGEQRGRYSLLGCDPDLIWQVKKGQIEFTYLDNNLDKEKNSETDPIKSLRKLLKNSKINREKSQPPYPILVGYLGYPMIQYIEKIKLDNHDNLNLPEAMMIRPKIAAVFDNIKDSITIMTTVYTNNNIDAEKAYANAHNKINSVVDLIEQNIINEKKNNNIISKNEIKFESNYTKDEYYEIIKKAKKYIKEGDIFQVVPSQRFVCDYKLDAKDFYRSLRRLNPSPFLVNLNFDNFGLVASSPEILVRQRNGKVTIRPIAGTRKRGKNPEEDKFLSEDLLNDKKELAEHLMLLDLGRNDIGKVSKIGSVKVTEKMIIEYYSHVMHIVSNVEGDLEDKYDSIDALISGFPAGTVSGAPKIRAMEIIEEIENLNRSFYGGAMGYFDSNGQLDSCISLRTGLITKEKLYIQAGGGIVFDSNQEKEYEETVNKAKALIYAAKDSLKYS
tara:strand:- start:368 stop:1858 length:1491 start_codon:yes stop_codon:yes gene_type:complete